MRTPVLSAACVIASLAGSCPALGGAAPVTVVSVGAVLDNTLYEDPNGGLSNGLGPNIFAGKTRFAGVRRALVEFDLSSVPANATIVSASVTLHLTRAVSSGDQQTLHRVLASWGEGTSNSGDETVNAGGGGEIATPGDATWLFRFFNGTSWASAGGDFDPAASATATVDDIAGPYVWTGAQLAADVQGWINDPSTNHGWMVRGVETGLAGAKRFASKDNPNANLRPRLTIGYTVPAPPCLGDLNNDGFRNTLDLTLFLGAFGSVVPPGTGPDFDGSGTVTTADLVFFLGVFGVPC